MASPFIFPPGYDKEVFRYVGMVIRNGGTPYIDVFDHKPPLIYVISAMVHGIGPFGLWLAEFAFSFIAGVMLFRRAIKDNWPFALFYPLFYFALYWAPAISYGGGVTRGFSASIILALLCLPSEITRRNDLIRGFLIGSVFLFQQEEILGLLPFLFILLLETPHTNIVHRIACWVLGTLTVFAPIGAWLAAKGALKAFGGQAFGINMTFYPHLLPLMERCKLALWNLGHSNLLLAGCILFVMSGVILAGNTIRDRNQLMAAWIACLGQVTSTVILSSHVANHYWLGSIPYFVLIAGLTFANLNQKLSTKACAGLLAALWALSPSLNPKKLWIDIQSAITRRGSTAYGQMASPLYKMMESSKGKPGQLFVFRFIPPISLNTDLNIISPVPYIYTHFWDDSSWDSDGALFSSILVSLDRYQTKWIVDFSPIFPIRQPLQYQWDSYIASRYDKIMHAGADGILYRRRNISNPT